MTLIQPRTLKGFRDYLPESMIPRELLVETARRVYRSFGFVPIDTPALEYLEILQGKGGEESDRQLYQFADKKGRMLGMRFDLTVPLARFVAQYHGELGMPFKRYQIATVWRGESPQQGRFREFMQCDFDTVGTTSVAADIETGVVIYELLRAIGFEKFSIRLNNRAVLNGLLECLGLTDRSGPILRALDKLPKIGGEAVAAEMCGQAGTTPEQARRVLEMTGLKGTNHQLLSQLEPLVAGSEAGRAGVARLGEILQGMTAAGVPDTRVQLDVSIARGLDYYTGAVFETFLDEKPELGSVCSGGRYDDLAGLFTREQLPGIGASLGLDRLLVGMKALGMLPDNTTVAPVLVTFFDRERLNDYQRIAAQLRRAGIAVEVFPDSKKLGQQLKYADRRGFQLAVIIGGNEFEAGTCQLKDLRSGQKTEVPLDEGCAALVEAVRELLKP